jgi:6-phosphogluconate dehydrogenase
MEVMNGTSIQNKELSNWKSMESCNKATFYKIYNQISKIRYMGMGISGGEEGARNGPSLMPGGTIESYKKIENILKSVSAKHESGVACVTYIGPGGAGNYVKMVHNGIEYGDMQLIAETYDILKQIGGLNNQELSEVFKKWNKNELESFLVEITSNIFKKRDDNLNKINFLVDKVLDKTGNKGTGKWTCKDAVNIGVDITTLVSALNARYMACMKDERITASTILKGPKCNFPYIKRKNQLIELTRQTLYASKICSYAQGMSLIQKKALEMGWNLNLGRIASIWRKGCIIRAIFLDHITEAFNRNSNLSNLLIDKLFCKLIEDRQDAWRMVVCIATSNGISIPSISGSLSYFDSYRRARLPANLTQAQRDCFGAHTYQRIDDKNQSHIHSKWF